MPALKYATLALFRRLIIRAIVNWTQHNHTDSKILGLIRGRFVKPINPLIALRLDSFPSDISKLSKIHLNLLGIDYAFTGFVFIFTRM